MLMQQLADYAINEQTAKLPAEVIHHAKRAVIDWYAALLPGSIVAPATLLEQAFADDLDRGKARLARGRRATVRTAALINGAVVAALPAEPYTMQAVREGAAVGLIRDDEVYPGHEIASFLFSGKFVRERRAAAAGAIDGPAASPCPIRRSARKRPRS